MIFNIYLDDERVTPQDFIRVSTVDSAKEWLLTGDVNELSLDHDLGACIDCQSALSAWNTGDLPNGCPHAETGMDLVNWMVETNTWPRKKPKVHSQNPIGSARMRQAIEKHWPQERHR